MSWQHLSLGEMTEPERPITYGVVKPGPEDPDQGVLFVRGGDIREGKIDVQNLRTITQEYSRPYARTILKGGELLISLVGNPGEVAIAPESLVGANIARQAGLIALRPDFDSRYVMYFLKSPAGRSGLFQRTQGAVQQVINLAALKTVKIGLPRFGQQQRIAFILSAYDDLIENNRRRIALLEEAARQLYKEWFVRFRFPGHEHVKIINGVPEGWQRLPASAAMSINPTTRWLGDGEIRSVPMAAVSEHGMCCDDTDFELRLKSTSVRFVDGDTLFARITPCLENGKTAFVNFLAEGEVACGSSEFIVFRERAISRFAIYLVAREDSFRANAIKSMIGSSGRQRVQPSCFDKYMINVPPKNIGEGFDEEVRPMFELIRSLDRQNTQLARARDLLLPKLMIGAIAV